MTIDMHEIVRAYEEADCLISAEEVSAALDRMAAEITAKLGESNPLIYSIMNGGLILGGRLLSRLPFPLQIAYLHVTRYGHALQGNLLDWRVRPTHDLRNRTVVVLDDILDEGHTLAAVIDYLKCEGASQVYSAVLAHKQHDRKAYPGMRADFTGVDIPDRFVFGCGMDYKGYWRNAPGIYAIKGL